MNKKYIIVLNILGILFGVSLLVGISYAYYIVNVSQTNKNIVKSSCLNLSISNEENVIKLEKQIPIMNEEGKKLTPYTFTINNTCNSMMGYSLNLEELEGSTLASKYIMTMVNDKSYVNMASLSSTDNYYANSVESRVLATGSLGPNASINYSLRLWMDEATPLTTDAMNKSFRSKVVVVATPTKSVDFDYTGTEQVFTVPQTGTYKIETWGAQGEGWPDNIEVMIEGGVGGYSSGNINLTKQDIIYINVGRQNENGSNGQRGGGATYIATKSGSLSTLKDFENNIIIVSGGGGGSEWIDCPGGSGGGFKGNNGKSGSAINSYGGSQTAGGKSSTLQSVSGSTAIYDGSFGQGGYTVGGDGGGQGGNGYYGGGASDYGNGGGGGSGYIGNSLLTNKSMYCYNCEESSEESTKTISTTCAEETPTSNCAKKGNGYARITYIG